MTNETGYFRLGLFIVIGVVLIVGGIVTFGAISYTSDGLIVETVTLQSVEGLEVGTPVKLQGVRVGRVRRIDLAAVRYLDKISSIEDMADRRNFSNAVIIEIGLSKKSLPEKDAKEHIEKAVENGLRARLASSGLTGPPYVELVFLDKDRAPEPLALPWKSDYLYIPSGRSTMQVLLDTVQEVAEAVKKADIGKILTHADGLLVDTRKQVNAIDVKELQGKAIALIDEVRDTNKNLQEILKNPSIAAGVKDFGEITGKVNRVMTNVEALIASGKINSAIDNLSKVATNANATVTDLQHVIQQLSSIIAAEQGDIQAAINSLRNTVENAESLTEDAKSNPSRLLFGQPPQKSSVGASK